MVIQCDRAMATASASICVTRQLNFNFFFYPWFRGDAPWLLFRQPLHKEVISSLANRMINHPKKGRGRAHVTHFACATVDWEAGGQSASSAVGQAQQCGRRRSSVVPTYHGRR